MIRWLAPALLIAAPAAWSGEVQWQELLASSRQYLARSQEALERDFHLADYDRWDLTQNDGELVFSAPGKPALVAKVVFVGSFAFRSETWLWAWANESVDASLTSKLGLVRKHGEEKGYRLLTETGWRSDKDEGWDMAAVTNYLLHGKGVYRPATEKTFLWVVLTEIHQLK